MASMNILLVSHQLDYSGAPIALLELAKSLLRLKHSVSISSLQTGPLLTEFAKSGIKKFDSSKNSAGDYDLIIANTIVSVPPSLNFGKSSKKVLAWIHESEYFFRILKKSPKSFRLDELEFAVFPSKFQIDEFSLWMPKAIKAQLKNCVQIPSDIILIGDERPYIICSGKWEERKSQIKLVHLLECIDSYPEVYFLGASNPGIPLCGKFIFTGPLTPQQAKSRIGSSQGVISCSISETQNLVAIEAMLLRVPVMLSDIPAHRELKGLIPDILLFDPDNNESFKTTFNLLLSQWKDEALRNRLKNDAIRAFGIEEFDKNVLGLLNLLSPFNDGPKPHSST
jgi:glycosyltransferase involved in cell wall biosynthesis